jgi:hypothetical protein
MAAASDELTGRLPCGECRENVEFEMEPVFRYVLQQRYGVTVEELESQLET